MNRFGECSHCKMDLQPVYFTEKEYEYRVNGVRIPTGRTRRAVSHLECPSCMKKECVDDSFDERWR